MKILFIHPNFPGQFKHLAVEFAKDENNEVVFICNHHNNINFNRVKKIVTIPKKPNSQNIHRYLTVMEKAIYSGQATWRVCFGLKKSGFIPDVIYAHTGWGDGLFLKDIFPQSKLIVYMEFYYQAFGADMNFYPNEKADYDKIARVRIRNAVNLIDLSICDWAISPTQWQASLFPREFRQKFTILHEGIDLEVVKPQKVTEPLKLPNGKTLEPDAEIVTYVARNFEPYRGFDQVMRSIEIVARERPNAHFLMVGSDGISYGPKLPEGQSFKQIMLQRTKIDPERIHWFGKLPFKQYLNILNYSKVHIYLTVPFVLSWSLLEAMAMGASIVASSTKPVLEVIKDNHNGLLANFFSTREIADKVITLLNDRNLAKTLSTNAQMTIRERYDLAKIMPKYKNLIEAIAKTGKNSTDRKTQK